MKNLKILLFGLACGFIIIACKNEANTEKGGDDKAMVTEAGSEYTSAYVCPMHCEGSGSDSAGTCPVCGMDYVALADHKSDGHMHDEETGHGHDHDNHDGHNH